MTTDGAAAGFVTMAFRHPPGAFLDRRTGPRLRIDGRDVQVAGWGEFTFPVAQGGHRTDVWVPYVMPRRAGRATTTVDVEPGRTVRLEYLAPTVTFARGSLGAPGQQVSVGARPVRWLNLIAFAAPVIVAVIALLGR